MAEKRAAKKTSANKAAKKSTKTSRGLDVDDVRAIFRSLAGVEEGTSYGTVSWKAKKKFLARVKEDGVTLVVRAPFELRDALIEGDPETFFITDHYASYAAVLVRLARVRRAELAALCAQAVEFVAAPKSGRRG